MVSLPARQGTSKAAPEWHAPITWPEMFALSLLSWRMKGAEVLYVWAEARREKLPRAARRAGNVNLAMTSKKKSLDGGYWFLFFGGCRRLRGNVKFV